MRKSIISFTAAGLAFAGLALVTTSTASASGDKFRIGPRGIEIGSPNRRPASRLGRINRAPEVRGYVARRNVDRLPISVTRPPNTGHYIHQDYPLWAARAFQPTRSR